MLLKGRDTRKNDRDHGICVVLLIPSHARAYTLFACLTFSNTRLVHTCVRTTPLRESGPSPSNFFSCAQSTRSSSIKRAKQYCFHNAFISSHMLIMHRVPASFSTLSLLPLLRLGSAAHSWTQTSPVPPVVLDTPATLKLLTTMSEDTIVLALIIREDASWSGSFSFSFYFTFSNSMLRSWVVWLLQECGPYSSVYSRPLRNVNS